MKKTGGRVAVPSEVRLALGERVKLLREKLGFTQEYVADRGGFARTDMSKFEKGANLSTLKNRQRLARGFDLDLADLVKYVDGLAGLEATVAKIGGPDQPTVEPLRLHHEIDRVGRLKDFSDAEREAASRLVANFAGMANLREDQALMLLDRARSDARSSKEFVESVVADAGGGPLDDFGGSTARSTPTTTGMRPSGDAKPKSARARRK